MNKNDLRDRTEQLLFEKKMKENRLKSSGRN